MGLFAVALVVVGVVAALVGLGGPQAPDGSGSAGAASSSPAPSVDPRAFLAPEARDAAPIELIDPAGRAFTLAGLRGAPVLVFFGYTHCPDVCPVTIGVVGQALARVGGGARAVFVSVDPERDTTEWLTEFSPYLPKGFTAVTGTAGQIRATADAWGVRYARVEGATPDAYSMSHTADVFIVDAGGRLRGAFPFGTSADQMTATLRTVLAEPAASTPPSPVPTPPATSGHDAASPSLSSPAPVAGPLLPTVVSSTVWAGGRSPVILTLDGPSGRLADPDLRVTVQVESADRRPVGAPVTAVPVRPPFEQRVVYVAAVDLPAPGAWWLTVGATGRRRASERRRRGHRARPGTSAALGSAAPSVRTPTLDDVGGDHWAVSTDPAPDLRLYGRSTSDALATGTPFVLVVDSVRFRVSPACGKAVVLARTLIDRWPAAAFLHVEPYTYAVVSETPVLEGDISDPPLNAVATAWGLDGAPWGSRWMPWVFVVDGEGVVRAKYQGVVGSDDVDVILALIAQGD